MHRFGKGKLIAVVTGDILLFYLALWITLVIRYYPHDHILQFKEHLIPFSIIFFTWIITLSAFGLYDFRLVKNDWSFMYRLIQASIADLILAVLVLYSIPFFQIEPRRNLLIIGLLATALIALWRYCFNIFIAKTSATRVIFFGLEISSTSRPQ